MRQSVLTDYFSKPRTADAEARTRSTGLAMADNGNPSGGMEASGDGGLLPPTTLEPAMGPRMTTDSGLHMLIEAEQLAKQPRDEEAPHVQADEEEADADGDANGAENGDARGYDASSKPSPAPTWPPIIACGGMKRVATALASAASPTSLSSTSPCGSSEEDSLLGPNAPYTFSWPSNAFLYARSDHLAFPLRRDRREALMWDYPASLVARFPSSSAAARAPQREISYPYVPHLKGLLELGAKPLRRAPVANYYHNKAITQVPAVSSPIQALALVNLSQICWGFLVRPVLEAQRASAAAPLSWFVGTLFSSGLSHPLPLAAPSLLCPALFCVFPGRPGRFGVHGKRPPPPHLRPTGACSLGSGACSESHEGDGPWSVGLPPLLILCPFAEAPSLATVCMCALIDGRSRGETRTGI